MRLLSIGGGFTYRSRISTEAGAKRFGPMVSVSYERGAPHPRTAVRLEISRERLDAPRHLAGYHYSRATADLVGYVSTTSTASFVVYEGASRDGFHV